MLKKIFIVAFLFIVHCPLFIISSAQPQSDSVTITTYYPSPAGVYRELRLFPSNVGTKDQPCVGQEGDMFYDQVTFALVVCAGNPAKWTQLGGGGGGGGGGGSLWINTTNSLYPKDSNWNVGIGTNDLTLIGSHRLVINGPTKIQGNLALLDAPYTSTSLQPGIIFGQAFGIQKANYCSGFHRLGAAGAGYTVFTSGMSEVMTMRDTGNVGIGTVNPSTGNQILKLDVEGAVGATVYCDENGNNCKSPSLIPILPTCAEGDFLKFSGGTWVCSGSGPCTKNCACAASTCVGSTCPDGCGGTCAGTKSCCTPDCACAAGTCVGSTCPNGCGGTCAGKKSCCAPDCSCATSTCQGNTCSDGCGGTCAGIKVCSCPATRCVMANSGICIGGTWAGGQCCVSGYPTCVIDNAGMCPGATTGKGGWCCLQNCPTCVLYNGGWCGGVTVGGVGGWCCVY